jgi:hypothetical protein
VAVEGARVHLIRRSLDNLTLTRQEWAEEWTFSHKARHVEPSAYTIILETP